MAERITQWLDGAIEWLLMLLIAFTAAAFGAVQAWSEAVVVALGALLGLLFAGRMALNPSERLRLAWAHLPMVGFLALVSLQLLPMPIGLLELISPEAAAQWEKAGVAGAAQWVPLSLYPFGSWHDLRMLAVVTVVFVVVGHLYWESNAIRRLLGWIVVIGAAVLVVFYVQRTFGLARIYGLFPAPGHPSGPFVGHTHFAQFVNLTTGAAIGLLLYRLARIRRTPRNFKDLLRIWQDLAPRESAQLLGLCAFVAAAALAVPLSMSRGGAAAAVLAGLAVLGLLVRRERQELGALALSCAAFLGFLIFAATGFAALMERAREIQFDAGGMSRWQQASDLFQMFRDFPIVGAGQGTHSMAYQRYQTLVTDAFVHQSDTYYPQILAETGLAGAALVLAFMVAMGVELRRALVRHNGRKRHMVAYGLVFGLLAVVLQTAVDFGQRLPANAILTACAFGIVVALARHGESGHEELSRAAPRVRLALRIAAVGGVAVLGFGATSGAIAAARAEYHVERADRIQEQLSERENSAAAPALRDRLVAETAAAVRAAPGEARYRSWLAQWRWYRLLEEANGRLKGAQARKKAKAIADDLRAARTACPVYGPLYSLEGHIRWLLGSRELGAKLVRRGRQLAPQSRRSNYIAGLIAIDRGRETEGLRRIRHAIELDGAYYKRAVRRLVHRAGRIDLAEKLASRSPRRLFRLVRWLKSWSVPASRIKPVRDHAVEALERACRERDTPAGQHARLARIYARRGRKAAAAKQYARALQRRYGKVGWRIRRAKLLVDLKRHGEAARELEIVLRIRPAHDRARKLLKSVPPEIGKTRGASVTVGSPG